MESGHGQWAISQDGYAGYVSTQSASMENDNKQLHYSLVCSACLEYPCLTEAHSAARPRFRLGMSYYSKVSRPKLNPLECTPQRHMLADSCSARLRAGYILGSTGAGMRRICATDSDLKISHW